MTGSPATTPFDILLVEDNPDDALLTREAFREGRLRHRIDLVSNGADALAYLRREGPYARAPRPRLVLLDINLPGMNGAEVLEAVKSDEALRDIPVIVLTTSGADEDVSAMYRRHANCYITKPVDLTTFLSVVERIDDFWFSVVTLPPQARGEAP